MDSCTICTGDKVNGVCQSCAPVEVVKIEEVKVEELSAPTESTYE